MYIKLIGGKTNKLIYCNHQALFSCNTLFEKIMMNIYIYIYFIIIFFMLYNIYIYIYIYIYITYNIYTYIISIVVYLR